MSRPTVVFDLGGVLVSVDFARACKRLQDAGGLAAALIREHIVSGGDKVLFDTGRLKPREFAERFCAGIGVRLPYDEFATIWCDIFSENQEVTSLLDEIAVKADLILLSNTDPLHLDFVRRRYGFVEKFKHLVLSYEVGEAKPAPRIFEQAISVCAPGSKAIYFDDVAAFAKAARACGLPAERYTGVAKLKRDLHKFGVL